MKTIGGLWISMGRRFFACDDAFLQTPLMPIKSVWLPHFSQPKVFLRLTRSCRFLSARNSCTSTRSSLTFIDSSCRISIGCRSNGYSRDIFAKRGTDDARSDSCSNTPPRTFCRSFVLAYCDFIRSWSNFRFHPFAGRTEFDLVS